MLPSAAMATALDHELRVFEVLRGALLGCYAGKFVVVKGDDVVLGFDTEEAACAAGAQCFGNEPMLIRQILPFDRVAFCQLR
jgi:hypothetical protein